MAVPLQSVPGGTSQPRGGRGRFADAATIGQGRGGCQWASGQARGGISPLPSPLPVAQPRGLRGPGPPLPGGAARPGPDLSRGPPAEGAEDGLPPLRPVGLDLVGLDPVGLDPVGLDSDHLEPEALEPAALPGAGLPKPGLAEPARGPAAGAAFVPSPPRPRAVGFPSAWARDVVRAGASRSASRVRRGKGASSRPACAGLRGAGRGARPVIGAGRLPSSSPSSAAVRPNWSRSTVGRTSSTAPSGSSPSRNGP